MNSKAFKLLLLLLPSILFAQWQPKVTPIKTPWTDLFDPNNPLPEYPRPQLVRDDWENLNGRWQFKVGFNGEAPPFNQNLPRTIVVPYAIEATLSGVVEHHERIWYRRTFNVPSDWDGQRILIHFDAIDWESEVYLNGTSLGIHKGGYDQITYDITDYLKNTGEQELVVRVFDPTRDYGQPRGKQTTDPRGIMYTATTGIWQTVWLEPVAVQHIDGLRMTPDIDNEEVTIRVNTENSGNLTTEIKVFDGNNIVDVKNGPANSDIVIPIPKTKLWSPESPFLYDVEVTLKNGENVVDQVSSYFGMRKIAVVKDKPFPLIYLNNKPIFMAGPLDQGYWPDGIMTPPSDEALRFDIEATKALGFNMTRKHIKVEPQRWYYWADKLGILVWQDMVSANSYDTPPNTPIDEPQYEFEYIRMIEDHYNSPSIIMWINFNEWQGQFNAEEFVDLARDLDPTRIVNQGSAGPYTDVGDIRDEHHYSNPCYLNSRRMASVLGEYGGIGYKIEGHLWGEFRNPYFNAENEEQYINAYSDFIDDLLAQKTLRGLSAMVYTEISDVEIEGNGFMTYDRLWKIDPQKIKVLNEKLIHQNLVNKKELLPTSEEEAQTWKYTTSNPGNGWEQPWYNDNNWATGPGGFGSDWGDDPNIHVRTPWTSSNIWIRKKFNTSNLTDEEIRYLTLVVFFDEKTEVFLNGKRIFIREDYRRNYFVTGLYNNDFLNAINRNGENTIAVSAMQTSGRQYVDAGLITGSTVSRAPNGVIAYRDCPFTGLGTKVEVGEYNREAMERLGIFNNDVSSIRVPSRYTVTLYDGDNLDGESIVLTENDDCLTNNFFSNNTTDWNDKVSSIKVEANGVTGLSGVYTIKNRNSGLFMEVENESNGANVYQNNESNNQNQQFQLIEMKPGVYQIKHLSSSKAVEISTDIDYYAANVRLWGNAQASNQLFIIQDAGNGYYKFIANHSGGIVEVVGESLDPLANVIQWDDNGQNGSHWQLEPVVLTSSGDGLIGNYFNGKNFEFQRFKRKDEKIDFNWNNESPNVMVNPDNFSVRWTGQIEPLYSEEYTFYITSDNGRRVWVNNELIIDKWLPDWGVEYTGNITLEAGKRYDIKIEYFDELFGANCKLSWSSASQVKEIVPQSQLYSAQLPFISIVTPTDNAVFTEAENINIQVDASIQKGEIERVEFYDGDNLIGEDEESPFEFTDLGWSVGEHIVSAIAVDDCGIKVASSPITVDITKVTGSFDVSEKSQVSLYPNPAKEELNVLSEKMIENIIVLNLQGQKVLTSTNRNIDVSRLKTGYYHVEIILENEIVTKAFIKE